MPTEIKYKRGQFNTFMARMKIRIGANDQGITAIEEGDEIEYDGSILKYAGTEISSPYLRGAIKAQWLFSVDSDVEAQPIAPARPGRQVARAQSVNTDLSRVQRESASTPMDASDIDEETVMEVGDRQAPAAVPGATRPLPNKLVNPNNVRRAGINPSEVDSQEGEVVGAVRSPATVVDDDGKQGTDVSKDSAYGKEMQRLANQKPIGKRPELPKEIEREGIHIKTNVGSVSGVILDEQEEGTVIGRVRKSQSVGTEGIEVKDTSNAARVATGQARGDERASDLHEAAVAHVQAETQIQIDTRLPVRVRIALYIDPQFPTDWDFSGKMKERMQRVKNFEITPAFLEAMYAAEGDNFRRALEKEYPDQFTL